MRREEVEAVVSWQRALDTDLPLEVTFHGGEPLLPGAEFYRVVLPLLREGLAPRTLKFAVQSNLWLLTDELCTLFRDYRVSVGTSLDGPESITDSQRGRGYFSRTMAGIERARARGIRVGCICTFTAQSKSRTSEIFDFFVREALDFTIHAALPSLRHAEANAWALSADEHGDLLVEMLDRYVANLGLVRIGTLDSLCRSVSAGQGGLCTFTDCLGHYLAVGPDGEIYPCQRFAGTPAYRLGNVHEFPSLRTLSASPAWRMFQEREEHVAEECGDCCYKGICRGGCPYDVLAANGGSFHPTRRDPHCAAYRRIFHHIVERATEEVFTGANLQAVVESADPNGGFLRRGKLAPLMCEGPHPVDSARHARRILAAVALAATHSATAASAALDRLGLVRNPARTEAALDAFHQRLTNCRAGLNNLYLHITFACPLRCTHCYAQAGQGAGRTLQVEDIARACRQAAKLGFRHAVITGGEPLVHPQRDRLLDVLAEMRQGVKPLLTVLRTSLALQADAALLDRLSGSTDEVVVSLDGDRETHDARRGPGSYDLTVNNLRRLVELPPKTNLSLATVLPLQLADGVPGAAVRTLAKELGIGRTRFRPLLPLGRAVNSEPDIVPDTIWGHMHPQEVIGHGFQPAASCGIGQNLYVEPDGAAYPCYAWHGENWLLGYITGAGGLRCVIASRPFQDLGCHTVDTNPRCRQCDLRYLCGGACRAWNRRSQAELVDLDAPPLDCSALHNRARSLLLSALEHVGVAPERWVAEGLPLPVCAPGVVQANGVPVGPGKEEA